MIATARTTILPITATDGPALRAYYLQNADHLRPWEPTRPKGYHDPAAWARRARAFAEEVAEGRAFRYAVRLTGQDDIIAVVNFTNVVRGVFQACTLGYSIAAEHEGKGLMFEALDALVEHVLQAEGLHRVMANHMPENARSAALLARLGFEEEGRARAYLKIAGQWRDHILTARLRAPASGDPT